MLTVKRDEDVDDQSENNISDITSMKLHVTITLFE